MGIDVEALKARLEQMNNRGRGRKKFRSDLWTPDMGEYTVRAIPWPESFDAGDTAPFAELWFYYGLGKRVRAKPLNEPDPVRELRDHLFENRSEANLTLARKLKPKMRCYLPVIVEALEDDDENDVKKGDKVVKIWSCSQTVYKKLLGFIVDPDYGDITDVDSGKDIKVEITDSGKRFDDGGIIRDIEPRVRPKSRPLTKQERTLLDKVPELDEIYPPMSYEQLEETLNRYIDGGPSTREEKRGGDKKAEAQTRDKPKTSSLEDAFDDLLV